MKDATLLWVDARLNKSTGTMPDTCDFPGHCHVSDNVAHAMSMADSINPDVIVFDFDYADITGLRTLRKVREKHPQIPLLMLAEQHYEGLSIWALRCRVWDYLVKPHDLNELMRYLDQLANEIKPSQKNCDWLKLLPANKIPREASIIGTTKIGYGISAAIGYIEEHLHERISADEVSQQCGLTRYELSRAFKSEYNMTFRDFLLKLRMERAARMLCCTQASISEIALSVGFNDISHFTRRFRKYFGCSAKIYRRAKHVTNCAI